MPAIFIITIIHAVIFALAGLLLGLTVFAIGFSEPSAINEGHAWLFAIWQVLNAPASFLTYYSGVSGWLWAPVQLLTSFIWANLYVITWSVLTKYIKSFKSRNAAKRDAS